MKGLYFDILRSIEFKCSNRFEFIKMSKRLYNMYEPYQRKIMAWGFEPPRKLFDNPRYTQCEKCQVFIKKKNFHTHLRKKCDRKNLRNCLDCLVAYKKHHKCKSKRCKTCTKWSLCRGCDFQPLNCTCNDKHLKIQFKNCCEVCNEQLDPICPNETARCRVHSLYRCDACGELGERDHKCSSLLNRIRFRYGLSTYQLRDNIFVNDNDGFVLIKLKDVYSIPNLIQFKKNVYAFIDEFKLILRYKNGNIEWTIREVPNYCLFCKTTINVTKKCSRCKQAYYCGEECQRNGWSEHKEWCYDRFPKK
jgi:hypothetical protein